MPEGTIVKMGVITKTEAKENDQLGDYLEVIIEGEKFPHKVLTRYPQGKALALECHKLEGQPVKYTLKERKGYWNLHFVEPIDGEPTGAEMPQNDPRIDEKAFVFDGKTHDIHKQVCLKAAVQLCSGLGIGALDDVKEISRTFMRWLEPDDAV